MIMELKTNPPQNYFKFFNYRSVEDSEKVETQRLGDIVDFYSNYNREFVSIPCPFCGDSDYEKADRFRNTFEVAKCNTCTSLYVNPRPVSATLREFYNKYSSSALTISQEKRKAENKAADVLSGHLSLVLKILDKIEKPTIRIAELGCGNGDFLLNLKNSVEQNNNSKSIEYVGIDINENMIKLAGKSNSGVVFKCASAEEYLAPGKEKFDIIIHWEIMEHLFDPKAFMKSIHKSLYDDGHCIFSTPNASGLDQIALGYNSKRYLMHAIYPPMHLTGFSTQNITMFAVNCGFKIVSVSARGRFDVDLVTINKNLVEIGPLRELADLGERERSIVQGVVNKINGSGVMLCAFKK